MYLGLTCLLKSEELHNIVASPWVPFTMTFSVLSVSADCALDCAFIFIFIAASICVTY